MRGRRKYERGGWKKKKRREGMRRESSEVHFKKTLRRRFSPTREHRGARGPSLFAESAMIWVPARSARVCKRQNPRERGWTRACCLSPRRGATTRLVSTVRRMPLFCPLALSPLCFALSLFLLLPMLSHLVVVVLVAREHAGGEPRGGRGSGEPGERERGGRFGDGPWRRRRRTPRRSVRGRGTARHCPWRNPR